LKGDERKRRAKNEPRAARVITAGSARAASRRVAVLAAPTGNERKIGRGSADLGAPVENLNEW
jgi:hypothetical protein